MKVALLINRDNFEKYSDWGDKSWEMIHIGNAAPAPDMIIATGADVLVVDAIMKIGPEIISKMPGLKMIHSQGVAFNGIDLDSAKSAGVYVCNNAGVNAYPVAEHAVLLMLALLKGFRYNEDMVYANRQMEAKMDCFVNGLPELGRLKIGIVGFGAIGRAIASLLKPFGCELFYYDKLGCKNVQDAKYLPLEGLYPTCDIISLNAPVTAETENMINGKALAMFKTGAILINTARGELMDHDAVVQALKSGKLGGLGTDVLAPEPYLPDNPLLNIPEQLRYRVALSPHIAGISGGTFTRAYERMRKSIEAVEAGKRPDCIVNGL